MKPILIALEGGDGTGKSTACIKLAEILGAVACVTPPPSYTKTRDRIDRFATPLEKYRYYTSGTMEASNEIGRILSSGKSVVVDRYWLTTYTYHELLGVPVSRKDFAGIIEPDLTILLALNNEVQISRMKERGLSIRDQNTIDQQQVLAEAFYRNVLKFSMPFFGLDSQRFGPVACARICAGVITSAFDE